jgi:hypothetical protein
MLSLQESFAILGYPLGEDSPVRFKPWNSSLIFTGSMGDFEGMENVVNVFRESIVTTQVKTAQVMLSTPEPVAGIAERVRAGDSQPVIREAASLEGAKLRKLPDITTRPGEKATVEIVNEFPRPAPEGEGFVEDWVGVRAESEASRYGFGLQQAINFETRAMDEEIKEEGLKPIFSVEHSRQLEIQEVGPAQASFLQVNEAKDGTRLHVVTSSEIVDATGRFHDPLARRD